MSNTYHVRVRGRTLGPYTLDAIRQMTRRAQVGRTHEVSLDGASWAPATAYPEIFERSLTPERGIVPVGGQTQTNSGVPSGPSTMWHYTEAGVQQAAPIDQDQLVGLISAGRVRPDDQVWCETMSDWSMISQVPELAMYALPAAGRGFPMVQAGAQDAFPDPGKDRSSGQQSPLYREFVGKKTAAGVCALLLGTLGIHKFMLGLTTGGMTMLLLCCMIIPIPVLSMIAVAEAIIYLSKSDEQFFRDYAVNKKQWF